jgi:two-component system heavy metal sensor histidine kinase CusS
MVKVVDGRELNGCFWVFYGALSNVEYELEVTDTVSGESTSYFNPSGMLGSEADTAVLSRADAGRLELRLQRLDLGPLVSAAAEDAAAIGSGLEVETEIPPGIEVQADRDLLGQVLGNLAANAVIHNRATQGKGQVRFELGRDETAVRLVVRNTAPPIPPAEAEKVFHRFTRLDPSRARSEGRAGLGLGLSLAREIARAHDGELSLGGYRDGMVSFVLTLPAA